MSELLLVPSYSRGTEYPPYEMESPSADDILSFIEDISNEALDSSFFNSFNADNFRQLESKDYHRAVLHNKTTGEDEEFYYTVLHASDFYYYPDYDLEEFDEGYVIYVRINNGEDPVVDFPDGGWGSDKAYYEFVLTTKNGVNEISFMISPSTSYAPGYHYYSMTLYKEGQEPEPTPSEKGVKHAIVRTDKLFGTQNKAGLASFKFVIESDGGLTPAPIENGNVVKIDGLMDSSREVYKAVAPSADTELKDILLVADPEVLNYKKYHSFAEFINEAGEVVRGYHLHSNDIFSVTAEAIDGSPDVGSIIELMDDTKLKAVESLTDGSTQVGKIIAKEVVGSIRYYVIQVASPKKSPSGGGTSRTYSLYIDDNVHSGPILEGFDGSVYEAGQSGTADFIMDGEVMATKDMFVSQFEDSYDDEGVVITMSPTVLSDMPSIESIADMDVSRGGYYIISGAPEMLGGVDGIILIAPVDQATDPLTAYMIQIIRAHNQGETFNASIRITVN